MKLWLLTQSDNSGYDTYDSCIVAAKTEEEARDIHPGGEVGWKYQRNSWAKSPDTVKVELLGTARKGTEVGMILSSYRAG